MHHLARVTVRPPGSRYPRDRPRVVQQRALAHEAAVAERRIASGGCPQAGGAILPGGRRDDRGAPATPRGIVRPRPPVAARDMGASAYGQVLRAALARAATGPIPASRSTRRRRDLTEQPPADSIAALGSRGAAGGVAQSPP
jgi:hypothetical protein